MTPQFDPMSEPLVPSPEVVARRVAGEYLLIPVRRGAAEMNFIFTANEVGSAIFNLIDGVRDGRAIAHHIALAFEVDEARALLDVETFLRDLCETGLARPERPEGKP